MTATYAALNPVAVVAAAILAASVVSTVQAQTRTWTGGGGNANSGNASNWQEGAPATDTSYHVVYNPANLVSTFRTTTTYNSTGLGFLSLSLAGNETYPGFTLMTGPVTVNGPVTATSGKHIFNVACTVAIDSTWDIASGAEIRLASASPSLTLASGRKITKTGQGTLFMESSQTGIAGTLQLDAGTIIAQNSAAMGTAALVLNAGTLVLLRDGSTSYGNNVTLGGSATVTSQRASAGDGFTQSLGTLAIGGQTLTANSGANVTSGTAGITFGTTTLSGNATFNVVNNVVGVTTRLRLGAVDGAGFGFTKAGSGILELTAAGTFSGAVRIDGGTLVLGNASAMVSAGLDMNSADAGTLGFGSLTSASLGALTGSRGIVLANDSAAAVTLTVGSGTGPNSSYSGVLSGAGGLTKGGSGTLTLSGNSSFAGQFNLGRGTVVTDRIGNAGETGPLGQNGIMILGGANNVTLLDYQGAGETTDKRIQIGSGGGGGTAGTRIDNTGSGALIFGNAVFNSPQSDASSGATRILTLGGTFNGAANRIDGIMADNNALNPVGVTVNGASAGVVWRLAGANAYTGPTTISGGVLEAASLANGGATSAIGVSGNAAANLVFGAASAALRYVGGADVTIDRGFTLSSGVNGGATIESSGAGTLSFDNAVAIAYGTADQTRQVTLSGSNTGANTFGKTLSNNGAGATSLVKDGAGAWAITAANTYTGGTTNKAGTLLVNNTAGSGTGSGRVVINSGATLGGTGIIGGNIVLQGGAVLAPGNSRGTLTAVNLSLDDGALLNWELSADGSQYLAGDYDKLILSGNLESGFHHVFNFLGTGYFSGVPTVYTLIEFSGTTSIDGSTFGIKPDSLASGLSGGITIDDNKVLLTVIPEPASLGTFGVFVLAALLLRRSRRA